MIKMNKNIITKLLLHFLFYLVCWILSYVMVNNDFNINLMVEYFKLAWSFNGFVRPTYTLILSLIIFLPITGIIYFISKKTNNNEKQNT
jgi:hypothetical protein